MLIERKFEVFNMKQMTVNSSSGPYPIYVGTSIRHRVQSLLKKQYERVLIVTDNVVASLYLADVKAALQDCSVIEAIIPNGEQAKHIEQYYHLQSIALENNLDRQSLIIALGGGVIGDLAGFVAATFMRGIDYIQMPTTILAHDSSVGGKVAINHELGKNLIGAFYPPRAVIYDIETIQSLPTHEIRSGFAEIVKEAYIADETLLHSLLQTDLTSITEDQLTRFIYEGIKIKAAVVEADEKESGMRKFLNFGHTLAHATESELGYGTITHGEAVAIGMLFALRISEQFTTTSFLTEQYKSWLRNNDYPLSLYDINLDHIITKMKLDKKAEKGNIQMVLLEKIGSPTVVECTDEQMKRYLQFFLKELNEI